MKRVLGLGAAVAGLLMSVAGSTATVPVSVVVDLNGPGRNLSADGTSLIFTAAKFALADQVSIKDGDLLQFTITFAGNETISVSGANSFQTSLGMVSGTANTSTKSTGTLKLLGPNVTSSSGSTTSSASSSELTFSDSFASLPDPTVFSGFYWEGTVDYTAFANGLNTTRLFDAPSFQIDADAITTTGSAPSVPEPATWAMMVIGFGAIGAGLRGRRSSSVTFA